MLVHALVGVVARVALGVAIAAVLAALLALVREDGSFRSSMEIACWLVGCLLLLLAVAGQSPTRRAGSVDPLLASFFPRGVTARMADPHSETTINPAVLLGLAAFALFGLAVALG
jgi:glycerol uptake facilitator-like aquaporin